MSGNSTTTISNTLSRFHYLSAGEFTGILTIQANKVKWFVLFHQGQIVWAVDCICPHRFWQRLIMANLPHLSLADLAAVVDNLNIDREIMPEVSWPYLALVQLYLDGQIDSQQLRSVLQDGTQDVLFNILQVGHAEKLTYRSDNCRSHQKPLMTLVLDDMMHQTLSNWQEWQNSGLTYILPDYIPSIDRSTALYQQTTTAIHKNLATIIDSQRSLREIAIKQRQDLLLLTRSLIPHLKQQIISLHPLPGDLPKPTVALHEPIGSILPATTHGSVAYIDDNACANQHMSNIITEIGYGFLGVEDAADAIELLVKKQPDLIIMESAMALANSRAICQQIRQLANLARVPLVLVVDQESLLERLLAKLAGANSIIAHPLDRIKIATVIQSYLGNLD